MSGDCGSVSSVLVCLSLDLGSTPDRSLYFLFPLDCHGLYMLTSNLIKSISVYLPNDWGQYIYCAGSYIYNILGNVYIAPEVTYDAQVTAYTVWIPRLQVMYIRIY